MLINRYFNLVNRLIRTRAEIIILKPYDINKITKGRAFNSTSNRCNDTLKVLNYRVVSSPHVAMVFENKEFFFFCRRLLIIVVYSVENYMITKMHENRFRLQMLKHSNHELFRL